jgi:hypothetical protein
MIEICRTNYIICECSNIIPIQVSPHSLRISWRWKKLLFRFPYTSAFFSFSPSFLRKEGRTHRYSSETYHNLYAGYSDEGVVYSSFDNPIIRTPSKAKAIIGVVNLCFRARFTRGEDECHT